MHVSQWNQSGSVIPHMTTKNWFTHPPNVFWTNDLTLYRFLWEEVSFELETAKTNLE